MQVRTFEGQSSQDVLAQIKAEMGPEAVILSNRSLVRNDVKYFEMTAGLEPQSTGKSARNAHSAYAASNDLGLKTRKAPTMGTGSTPAGWEEWHQEWSLLKEHLYAVMKPALQLDRLTPRQRVSLEYLQKEGVADSVVVELYRQLLAVPGGSILDPLCTMAPARPWLLEEWPEKLHVLAGPFGAGKTSAALRMALALRDEDADIRIAFINADCSRGNGRLVLKHWAELSGFAYTEAYDAGTMRQAIHNNVDADRIFVDMSGLDRGQTLAEILVRMGLVNHDPCVHIAFSPHHGGGQAGDLLARYATDFDGSLVWTKLDEVSSYAALLNIGHASGRPASALSYGPNMRNSFAPAHDALLWRLVFKRQLPNESHEAHGTA